MNLDAKQKEAVELLARNEDKIGMLYSVYADKFPQYSDFWSGLVKDEQAHACWLRKLTENIDTHMHFNETRIKPSLIDISLRYLDEKIEQARSTDINFSDALNIAIELETNLIESQFLTTVEGDSQEFKKVLSDLTEATHGHVERVRALWLKEK